MSATKPKLIYDARDSLAVRLLAKELGAHLDGSETDLPVIPLYICELLNAIVLFSQWLESPHPIRAIAAVIRWSVMKHVDDREYLIGTAKSFQRLICTMDYEDGWPACRWLNGIYGCCIALQLSLEDPEHIRWPAESGNWVANLIRGPSVHTMVDRWQWSCAVLLRARHAATKLKAINPSGHTPPPDQL